MKQQVYLVFQVLFEKSHVMWDPTKRLKVKKNANHVKRGKCAPISQQ